MPTTPNRRLPSPDHPHRAALTGDAASPARRAAGAIELRVDDGRLPETESLARFVASADTLEALTLVHSGIADGRLVGPLRELEARCRERRMSFGVDFVLDAGADACAAVSGEPTSLRSILDLTRSLRAHGSIVRWRIPVQAALAYRLEALFSLAADEGVEAWLVPADVDRLDGDARRFVADFVAYRLLDEDRHRLSSSAAGYYDTLLNRMQQSPAAVAEEPELVTVFAADAEGKWHLRTERGSSLPGSERETHAAPRSLSGPSTGVADVLEVLTEGARAIAQWTLTAATGKAFPGQVHERQRTLPRVLVIGAYGGDHIGDTAIVGGVLLRMHRRYATTSAIIVSQRPEHTRRLVNMLDVPVRVTVEAYRQQTAASLLAQVDAVVFAGGPLMDLPKQLVKHLYTVARARRAGKPFVIEGIGAGPFIRRVSAWTARLLVLMAERITVRTAEDARKPLVRGLDPVVGHDPAFDYLATRATLTRVADVDRPWLDRLFAGTAGRVTVAINLRPLRPDYSAGASAGDRARFTRMVEERFEARLAEAMKRFHELSSEPPRFIFFPMNAIQFGSSDLRSAYRVKRLVGDGADVRVWEGDPGIDGVIALLRRVDAAITMRFHATIYALSQRTPVIGVDYRPGVKDKVAALLGDFGQAHNCGRIDEVTVDWLLERLAVLTAGEPVNVPVPPGGISESTLRRVPPPVAT